MLPKHTLDIVDTAQQLHGAYRSKRDLPDLRSAVELYERALRETRSEDIDAGTISELYVLAGWAYADLARHGAGSPEHAAEAARLFETALDGQSEHTAPDRCIRLREDLARLYRQLDTPIELPKAVGHLEHALRIARAHISEFESTDFIAEFEANLGFSRYRLWQLTNDDVHLEPAVASMLAAQATYTEAAFPFEHADLHEHVGLCHGALGLRRPREQRHRVQAVAALEIAAKSFRRQQNVERWLNAQIHLATATIFLARTRFHQTPASLEAIAYLEELLPHCPPHEDPVRFAVISNTFGAALMLAGRRDPATCQAVIEHLERGAAAVGPESHPEIYRNLRVNLAKVYLTVAENDAEIQKAVAEVNAVLESCTLSNDECVELHCFAASAHRRFKGNRSSHARYAIRHLESAHVIDRSRTAQGAELRFLLARSYLRLAPIDPAAPREQAEALLEECLEIWTPGNRAIRNSDFYRMESAALLGDSMFQRRSWGSALETYEILFQSLTEFLRGVIGDSGRRRLVWSFLEQFENAIVCALELGKVERALELSELAKSQNLANVMRLRRNRPPQITDDQLINLRKSEETAQHAGDLMLADSPEDVIHRRLGPLFDSWEELKATSPEWPTNLAPASFREVSYAATRLNAVVAVFRVLTHTTFVFMIGPNQDRLTSDHVLELPAMTKQSLAALASAWWAEFSRGPRLGTEVGTLLQQLTALGIGRLWATLHFRHPRIGRLVVVPNNDLALLPVHCAVSTIVGPGLTGTCRYLLEEYEVSYEPCCSLLVEHARQRGHDDHSRTLLAISNPDGTLKHAESETNAVMALFPEQDRWVLSGADATREQVLDRMEYGTHKLFTCHGRFVPSDPLRSFLAMANGTPLTAEDILNAKFGQTRLAVLSACDTGLAQLGDGEDEYAGLSTAFLAAGAEAVVSSLWKVDDLATSLLMAHFHEKLHAGAEVATALRDAQLWVRTTNDHKLEHPYWWAAFQCWGIGWDSRT